MKPTETIAPDRVGFLPPGAEGDPLSRSALTRMPGAAGPEISFIVAAYNVAPFVEAAVCSALAQEECQVEVIVVDDSSSDESAAIVAALAERDGRVRLIRRPQRGGVSSARNEALLAATGLWVAVLDGDDLLSPGRSRYLLDLAAATSADVVADNIMRFSEVVDDGLPALPLGRFPHALQIDVPTYMRANRPFGRGPNLGYLKPMIRRSFLRGVGLRYDERLTIGEDYRLGLEALLADARFVVSSVPFYHYRVRAGSLSWRLTARDLERMVEAHAELVSRVRSAAPEIVAAALDYGRALQRAVVIQQVVDAAKTGQWSRALLVALRQPASWGFFASVCKKQAARLFSQDAVERKVST